MIPAHRESHARDMLNNPLFDEIMSALETSAIESMVYAQDDETRLTGALRVKAVRSFRSDCEAMLRSDREPKAAPA